MAYRQSLASKVFDYQKVVAQLLPCRNSDLDRSVVGGPSCASVACVSGGIRRTAQAADAGLEERATWGKRLIQCLVLASDTREVVLGLRLASKDHSC